ncbi:hypothetical protein [Serratia sp. JSRIV001]|uniref:hypothetical protein n=1 Tax=Serratia sp. JSRIV001 TaxID=2831893 RepID=UPI001CBF7E68|nr:hypothetical protein [Serratia sp. JSRIV001]
MTVTFSAEERSDKTVYIHEAMAQGYTRMLKMPLHLLSDEQLRDEHGRAWQFFDMAGKAAKAKAEAEKAKHDQHRNGFEEAAKPLIKWLAENVHPHHTVIVTSTNAELLEGICHSPLKNS